MPVSSSRRDGVRQFYLITTPDFPHTSDYLTPRRWTFKIEMPAPLERIEIFTHWVGFADPSSHAAKLIITRVSNRFLREWLPQGQTDELPAECITQLFVTLSRPVVPQLDPSLFDLPQSVIRGHYESMWTDDHPSHLLRIISSAGRVITIRTSSQHAFMLPLKVIDSATHRNFETFDPRLSQAMAALMPQGYLHKERLAGQLGMLTRDWQEHVRQEDQLHGQQLSDVPTIAQPEVIQPEVIQPSADVSQARLSSAGIEAAFGEILRILSGEETPEEKAEAERSGTSSGRLLKRIALQDVRELLAQGADPNVADDAGQTALMHAAWPPLDREKFRLLVQHGADLEARRRDGCTGLHLACAGGEVEAAREWVQAGADIQARTPDGATPLMLAATCPAIARLLVAAGADVNAMDEDGHTALVCAILKPTAIQSERQLEAMRALIDAGADMNGRDHEGLSPLGHARRMLAQVQIEDEVFHAFHANANVSSDRDHRGRRMAEAVMSLIASVGGRE